MFYYLLCFLNNQLSLLIQLFIIVFFSLIGGSDYKLIYRHYATLYFVFCVDSSESELGILDLIQVFVETLDKCFENVCELDLIFHVDKVICLIYIKLLFSIKFNKFHCKIIRNKIFISFCRKNHKTCFKH